MPSDLGETVQPKTAKAFRAWLEKHHARHSGLFVVIPKVHVLAMHPDWLSYEQAVEEALCFGWIDGLTKRYDDDFRAIRFSPRRDDSLWSESNKARVTRLIAAGRLTPAGLRLIELAKKNGEWAAARRREALTVPTELASALSANPKARSFWDTLAPGQRKLWLYWVTEAKKDETKTRRIAAVVKECAAGRKPGATTPKTT